MQVLLSSLSTVVRLGGILISEKSDRNNSYTRYFTPAETKARAQELFELAEQIARPYILAADSLVAETVEDENLRGGRRRRKRAAV
jgi:hypothetical protein